MAVNDFEFVSLIGSPSATVIPKLDLAYQICKDQHKNKAQSYSLDGTTNSIQDKHTIKCNCISIFEKRWDYY